MTANPYTLLLGTLDVALGVTLLAGSEQRTSSLAFAAVKVAAPIDAWALLFVLAGTLLTVGGQVAHWLSLAGAGLGAVVLTYWTCAFYIAATWNPAASTLGIPLFGATAAAHIIAAVLAAQRPRRAR